jgi:hypothetical protein
MDCFSIAGNDRIERFRLGDDYGEGHDRLHWTLRGIEKLIRLGLWRREYDMRGKLKSKPLRVEVLMELGVPKRYGKSVIPTLRQATR